jgi:hypothetical protein
MADTPGSVAIRESQSILLYPAFETVHVLSLCVFLGLAVMLDLRLLGITLKRAPVSDVVGRLLPWTAAGFAVQVVSGALLFYSNPVKFAANIFFRAKVVMIVLAGLNAWVFQSKVYRRVATWDRDVVPPVAARAAAGLSLMLWTGIVICGRLIAFYFQ